MQAILKTPNETFSHLNGHTFWVEDMSSLSVKLSIIGYEQDLRFALTEILIVDLDNAIRSLESRIRDYKEGLVPNKSESYYLNLKRSLGNLQSYCIANGFEFNVD